MEFTTDILAGNIKHIKLNGRLDSAGSQLIDQKFSFATTTRSEKIIVDLTDVPFMASIGIRLMMSSARGQAARGGKLVLAAPQPMVRKVLETTGIDKMITIVATLEEAISGFA